MANVVRWSTPQRRVAPGQSVVFFDPTNSYVLGGGNRPLTQWECFEPHWRRQVTKFPAQPEKNVPGLVNARA